jgi:geranylgeranyl pyrophosphate synthase
MATKEKVDITSSMDVFVDIIEKNGRATMDKAIEQVLEFNYDAGVVSSAVKRHVKFLNHVLPLVPALMNLSCEATGGNKDTPVGIGAALTLLVEAANIHDDIIDQTTIKHKRKTTFGKFGTNITILTGDFLLIQASFSLFKECNCLPPEQKNIVLNLTFEALAKISKSAAKETKMQKRFDVSPSEYLEIVRLRATVPEAHCMIGGILGGGTESMIASLHDYGRNYGIVGTVIDEFMDLFDYTKFSNRLKNEVVPLPILCALQDSKIKTEILPLLEKFEATQTEHDQIVRAVLNSEKVKKLQKEISTLSTSSNIKIEKTLKENRARENLSTIQMVVKELLSNIGEFTNPTL